MAFVASLAAMAIFAFAGAAAPERLASRRRALLTGILPGTALVAFATMCVGAYVSSSGAGLACIDIPNCAGNVVVYTPGQAVQMLHRFIAAACLLAAAVSFALTWALARRAAGPHCGFGRARARVRSGRARLAQRRAALADRLA